MTSRRVIVGTPAPGSPSGPGGLAGFRGQRPEDKRRCRTMRCATGPTLSSPGGRSSSGVCPARIFQLWGGPGVVFRPLRPEQEQSSRPKTGQYRGEPAQPPQAGYPGTPSYSYGYPY